MQVFLDDFQETTPSTSMKTYTIVDFQEATPSASVNTYILVDFT